MELLILLLIVLLFFGAKRIPQLGRSLGSGIREFRQGISGAANDETQENREAEDETKPPPDGTASSQLPHTNADDAQSERKS